MISFHYLEVGYRSPPITCHFGQGWVPGPQDPSFRRFLSTHKTPNWLKLVPNLNRHYQAYSCVCYWKRVNGKTVYLGFCRIMRLNKLCLPTMSATGHRYQREQECPVFVTTTLSSALTESTASPTPLAGCSQRVSFSLSDSRPRRQLFWRSSFLVQPFFRICVSSPTLDTEHTRYGADRFVSPAELVVRLQLGSYPLFACLCMLIAPP